MEAPLRTREMITEFIEGNQFIIAVSDLCTEIYEQNHEKLLADNIYDLCEAGILTTSLYHL
jgi:hypothetical protein